MRVTRIYSNETKEIQLTSHTDYYILFYPNIRWLFPEFQLAALAQMVACLPLVQQVWGSIPGGVVNFNLKIFNLGARRGWRCTLSNRQIVHHTPGLNSKSFRSMYCMLRMRFVCRMGTLNLTAPLVLFKKSRL